MKFQALKCYDLLNFFLFIQNGSNLSRSLTLILVTQDIPNAQNNAKTFAFYNLVFS